jgi:hypothetical protein
MRNVWEVTVASLKVVSWYLLQESKENDKDNQSKQLVLMQFKQELLVVSHKHYWFADQLDGISWDQKHDLILFT